MGGGKGSRREHRGERREKGYLVGGGWGPGVCFTWPSAFWSAMGCVAAEAMAWRVRDGHRDVVQPVNESFGVNGEKVPTRLQLINIPLRVLGRKVKAIIDQSPCCLGL